MGIEKFLKNLKNTLGINLSKKEIKENSMKEILDKLLIKLKKTNKKLDQANNKKEKEKLLEEKEILKMQIKKANKVLKKLQK